MLNETRHIHFIGIGGIGMSALAEIMHRKGFTVSGSDQSDNEQTGHLRALGIHVYKGHDASHVQGNMVIYSSAVGDDNPELKEARKQNCLCVKRAELLGEFLRDKKGIAVAGTHGKTTTSAMTGMTFVHAGFDPTLFVGGVITELNSNSRLGSGEWVVVEADEYDRSFLQLHPWISVINNIEADHLDCYKDIDDLKETFVRFANQTSLFGLVLVNIDQPGSESIIPMIRRRILTYGISAQADVSAGNLRISNGKTEFEVTFRHKPLGSISLTIPGRHQITNALACIGAALEAGIQFGAIRTSLEQFRGTHRRFEILGEHDGILWIDDYAHHPTEITATLKGARDYYPDRRIVAVFQPHLYSRTRDFMNEFAVAFSDADSVWMTDIYAAREKAPDNINLGEMLFESAKSNHSDIHYVSEKNSLLRQLLQLVRANDVVITMGAGDITHLGRDFLKKRKA